MPESEASSAQLLERLDAANHQDLPPATRLLAAFVLANRPVVLASSATDLAQRLGVSNATVIRGVQMLGFRGLPHLKQCLAEAMNAETTGPAADFRNTLDTAGADVEGAVTFALALQRESLASLDDAAAQQRVIEAVRLLGQATRIVIFGIGPTAHLARYMAAQLARAGRTAGVLDAAGISLADQLLTLRDGDALLALTYGKAYREITAALAEARRLRLPIVIISDTASGVVTAQADVLIPARRGRAGHVALHGTTLVTLETMLLGLAACDQPRAMTSLVRLNQLRRSVADAEGG